MIALRLFAFFLLISTALPVSAQEDPLHRTEMKPSPAGSPATSPESTTPPSSGPKSSRFATTAPPLTDVLFKNLKARSIGPAVMGGRVSDIALDPHNPFIFYVGLAHGGVFKTEDNGVTFDPIFDKQPVLSIGAVAVALSDSNVIWVGTGEANDRNSSGWGNGVYRSIDGGENWENVGLKESRAIARIVVHPSKPDVAYVAVSGHLWTDGGERGLFKATDGGKAWKLIFPTPKALTRALSALSPSSVGSCHLCRGFPARSIRDGCVELRKPSRSQQKIAQFRWASLSLQPVLARLRCVLAKIDSRYWV
jgi:hypothetical protein